MTVNRELPSARCVFPAIASCSAISASSTHALNSRYFPKIAKLASCSYRTALFSRIDGSPSFVAMKDSAANELRQTLPRVPVFVAEDGGHGPVFFQEEPAVHNQPATEAIVLGLSDMPVAGPAVVLAEGDRAVGVLLAEPGGDLGIDVVEDFRAGARPCHRTSSLTPSRAQWSEDTRDGSMPIGGRRLVKAGMRPSPWASHRLSTPNRARIRAVYRSK